VPLTCAALAYSSRVHLARHRAHAHRFAKRNFVDHSVTAQASTLRFIEDNWNLGRLGNQSFDARDGTLANLFDF